MKLISDFNKEREKDRVWPRKICFGIVAESCAKVAFFGSFNWKLIFNYIVILFLSTISGSCILCQVFTIVIGNSSSTFDGQHIEDNIVNPPNQHSLSFFLYFLHKKSLHYDIMAIKLIAYCTLYLCVAISRSAGQEYKSALEQWG